MFLKADGSEWGKNHHVRPLAAACKQASVDPPISFHELRHTYASILAQAGADLLTISKLLGHADTRITSRHYAHLCDKTLARTVRDLLPGFGHVPDDKVTKRFSQPPEEGKTMSDKRAHQEKAFSDGRVFLVRPDNKRLGARNGGLQFEQASDGATFVIIGSECPDEQCRRGSASMPGLRWISGIREKHPSRPLDLN